MSSALIQFQDTPNPDALKCILSEGVPPIEGGNGLRSYHTRDSAAGDPLGSRLMTLPGVVGVLINPQWITVTRAPGTDWRSIKAGVKQVLGGT